MLAWRILPFILLLGSMLALPGGQAQTADSAEVAVCAPPYPVAAAASIGAGYINMCVYYSKVVATSASTLQLLAILTGPATVVPVFNTAASYFVPNSGCTEGTPAMVTPTTNGIVGTLVNFGSIITMNGEQCDGSVTITLTIGVVPLQIYSMSLPIMIQTENHRVDNFNYLCDAPAIAPNAYSTTATTCNDPNLALTGSLTATLAGSLALSGTVGVSQSGSWTFALTGIPDTQQEIQAIADALTAGLDVTICPEVSPCYQVLSGALDANLSGSVEAELSGRINTDLNGTLAITGVDVSLNQTIGNQSIDVVFPETLEVTNAVSDFWVPVFLWAVAIIIFLWVAKLLAAGASTIGFVFALLGNTDLQVLALVILGVALWLEASARERIYARWFRKRFEAKQSEGRRTGT